MTPLERRYRSLLRVLPASYRLRWDDEMVATFLDTRHTDDPEEAERRAVLGRPGAAELASVLGLAVRVRLGAAEPAPRSLVWGEAVRRVALVGLLTQAVLATVGVVHELWVAGALPWTSVPDVVAAMAATTPRSAWMDAWSVVPLLWVGAYVALVVGHRAAAKVLAGLALAPVVLTTVIATVDLVSGRGPASSLMVRWADMLVTASFVLALAAFHADAPRPRIRPWLLAYVLGVLVAVLPAASFVVDAIRGVVLLDWTSVSALALVTAAVVHLSGRALRGTAWSLALAMLAGASVVVRGAVVVDLLVAGVATVPAARAIDVLVGTGALAVVGVTLAVVATRRLRALAPVPSPASMP